MPSGPKRSATDGSGSAASAPAVRMPSASSSSGTRAVEPQPPDRHAADELGARRRRRPPAAVPAGASAAAARAVKRPGPGADPAARGRQLPASSSSRPSPPCIRSSPSARNSARPGASGSTAAPIPSSPASSSSLASATAPGSAVTGAIRGQRAIASPARMPGRTPKVAAAAFTSPISGGPPGFRRQCGGRVADRASHRHPQCEAGNERADQQSRCGHRTSQHRRTGVRWQARCADSAGHVEPHLRVDRARVVLLDHGRVEHLAAGVAEEAPAAVEPSQRAPVTGMATRLLGLSWHRTQASDGLGHGAR